MTNPITEKQLKYDRAYLRLAASWAILSHCNRKKVGAIIVKDGMIISDGYNGTPSGFDNCCENDQGETHWYVLHAEANAILKVAKSTNNCLGATLYLTLSVASFGRVNRDVYWVNTWVFSYTKRCFYRGRLRWKSFAKIARYFKPH